MVLPIDTSAKNTFHIFGSDYPTRHIRVQHMAAELEVQFKINIFDFGACKDPAYIKKVQPNAWWPGVVYNGHQFLEAQAAIEFMLRSHHVTRKHELLPLNWTEEQAATNFDIASWSLITLDNKIINGPLFDESQRPESVKWWNTSVNPRLEHYLRDNNEWINGDTFSCSDVYMAYTLFLAKQAQLIKKDSVVDKYLQRLLQRPAFAGAVKQYK